MTRALRRRRREQRAARAELDAAIAEFEAVAGGPPKPPTQADALDLLAKATKLLAETMARNGAARREAWGLTYRPAVLRPLARRRLRSVPELGGRDSRLPRGRLRCRRRARAARSRARPADARGLRRAHDLVNPLAGGAADADRRGRQQVTARRLSSAQHAVLAELAEPTNNPDNARRLYGRGPLSSAAVLVRLGFARDHGFGGYYNGRVFAITPEGRAYLAAAPHLRAGERLA